MQKPFERENERFETAVRLLDESAASRAELKREYRIRSEAAFAPSTRRTYLQMMKSFKKWCKDRDYSPEPPISPIVIARYVEFLGGQVRPNTIETRLWAISEYHNSNFMASPTRHRLVELALKGVKRTYGAAVGQAPPLSKRELLDVISSMGDRRIELRDKAALWLASDSWCRASELVALRVKDLAIQEDGSSLLNIRRSKTDQFGQGGLRLFITTRDQSCDEMGWNSGTKIGRPNTYQVAKGSENCGNRQRNDFQNIQTMYWPKRCFCAQHTNWRCTGCVQIRMRPCRNNGCWAMVIS